MCLHTEILRVFVVQELKRSRYLQSYKFDQDLITDAKSKLLGDG
uniref:Uncharacterized protein n=1 Tax=Arundo donax TaxID=35708 RepID=A0A0A9ETC4_ARUDO